MNQPVTWNVIRVLNVAQMYLRLFAAFRRDHHVSIWYLQFMILANLWSEFTTFSIWFVDLFYTGQHRTGSKSVRL